MSENVKESLENPFDREVEPVRRSRWRTGLVAVTAVSVLVAGLWGGVALAEGEGEGSAVNWWAYDTVDGDGEAGPFSLTQCQQFVALRISLGYEQADCYQEVDATDEDDTGSDYAVPAPGPANLPEIRPNEDAPQPGPGDSRLPLFAYQQTLVATDTECTVQEDIVHPYTGEIIARAGDQPVIYRVEQRLLQPGESFEWLDLSNVWLRCPQPGDPLAS